MLYERVKCVLERNLSERHLRGGDATRKKYEEERIRRAAREEGAVR